MKTGLYFGSFNPIHLGHLAIASYMVEFTDINQVWFVISPQNPLKRRGTLLADYHRLELVERAIIGDSSLKASDIEFKLSKPSYTIDTLTYLSEKHARHNFILIMGEDNLHTLPKWKNYTELLNRYPIYVYPREGKSPIPQEVLKILEIGKITLVNAPRIEISSSFIRQSIRGNKNMTHFLPKKVWEYIDEMNFYKKN
jgi:nicotinate-nucleotide adenylyltransferase